MAYFHCLSISGLRRLVEYLHRSEATKGQKAWWDDHQLLIPVAPLSKMCWEWKGNQACSHPTWIEHQSHRSCSLLHSTWDWFIKVILQSCSNMSCPTKTEFWMINTSIVFLLLKVILPHYKYELGLVSQDFGCCEEHRIPGQADHTDWAVVKTTSGG